MPPGKVLVVAAKICVTIKSDTFFIIIIIIVIIIIRRNHYYNPNYDVKALTYLKMQVTQFWFANNSSI